MLEVTIPEHSAPGGAVHATGLKHREGKRVTLPCGCCSDDTRWLVLCDAVYAAVQRVRALCAEGRVPTITGNAHKAEPPTDPLLE